MAGGYRHEREPEMAGLVKRTVMQAQQSFDWPEGAQAKTARLSEAVLGQSLDVSKMAGRRTLCRRGSLKEPRTGGGPLTVQDRAARPSSRGLGQQGSPCPSPYQKVSLPASFLLRLCFHSFLSPVFRVDLSVRYLLILKVFCRALWSKALSKLN